MDIITRSAAETIELGRRIGSALQGGEVFAVEGPLGSGKTQLIKGIAAGADAEALDQVNSPTFVLVNEYQGQFDIFHIDAYRLDTAAEFEMLGFDDFLYPQSVVLIEWADKVTTVLETLDCISVKFRHISQEQRAISIQNLPNHLKSLIEGPRERGNN
ncbi:MAG: tRNA (adenosine(37)-N6)-threonylcarbamoyltransferase complex ATPase subunit type 1 TsaE [Planctomycetes bacterium]|nr:tRNA (adenosine(37)-N6)-threonylcarbamoyltransferase complex ATPase subunit type 1 TsaE [Planctomycetota bacterium]